MNPRTQNSLPKWLEAVASSPGPFSLGQRQVILKVTQGQLCWVGRWHSIWTFEQLCSQILSAGLRWAKKASGLWANSGAKACTLLTTSFTCINLRNPGILKLNQDFCIIKDVYLSK